MMSTYRPMLPGFLVAVLLAGLALLLASFTSLLSVILLGFLLGVLAGNLYPFSRDFQDGFGFTGTKFLEISVVFLAFSIKLSNLQSLGWQSVLILLVTIVTVIVLSIWLSRWLQFKGATAWLTGFGTAICGSSAIAAAAPLVGQKREEVGISLAVVNLLGSIAMIALPFLFHYIDLSAPFKGLIIGGTLHSVGNVAGAAYAVDDAVGEAAITVKLARVALLSPALVLFNYLVNKGKGLHWKAYFKLPVYLWVFIVITVMVSVVDLPKSVVGFTEESGKIILTIAMAAIGLRINIRDLLHSGRKAILFGILIFVLQLLLVVGMGYMQYGGSGH